ncbi:MAG: NAD(P)-dependent alcohol dehydrogenase [Gammaproteobacteria bacterium]|nr:NAD(P)-dependent alcohol dehydrogenase [Gammaproteobacteria bacterium]
MKAIVFTEYGSTDVLQLTEVPTPVPGDDEVLVKVHAASINDWDWAYMHGEPFFTRVFTGFLKPRLNIRIPGCDIAGQVEAVGKNVERFQAGDNVYGDLCQSGFGAFAEYVCAPETALAPMASGMTFNQAASIPQAAMLTVQGLFDAGNLQAGQKLLINGAGGGVGTFGVQIARTMGVEITAVDSSIKLDMLRSLGADHVIDYREEDFTRNGRHYDVILDTRTKRSILDCARSLSPHGVYATVGGSMPRIVQALLLGPWISRRSKKKIRVVALKPNKDLAYMNELFEAGKVTPVMDGPYPLSEVPEALRYFGKAEHKGKVIITIV